MQLMVSDLMTGNSQRMVTQGMHFVMDSRIGGEIDGPEN
jgi:hypothetical protein